MEKRIMANVAAPLQSSSQFLLLRSLPTHNFINGGFETSGTNYILQPTVLG